MLSQNEFGSHGHHQRSVVEAMEARKQSQTAQNESQQQSNFQTSNRTYQPEYTRQNNKQTPKHQNFIGNQTNNSIQREVISLDKKIEELTKMPGIHDMANGYFCPVPLYYSKVDLI